MKNNPRYTFGDRIFVRNEEAEVLGIWRARGVGIIKSSLNRKTQILMRCGGLKLIALKY
jgi:hypothetical protein